MSETQCYYDPSRGYPRGGCYSTPIHKILNVPVSCQSHHLRSERFFLSGQHSPKHRSQKLSIDPRSHHHGLHHSLEYLLVSHSMQSVSTARFSPSPYPYSTIPIELSSFPHFRLASPPFRAIHGTIAKTRIAVFLFYYSQCFLLRIDQQAISLPLHQLGILQRHLPNPEIRLIEQRPFRVEIRSKRVVFAALFELQHSIDMLERRQHESLRARQEVESTSRLRSTV